MTSWWRMVPALFTVLIVCAIPVSKPVSYFIPLWALLFVLYTQYTLPKQFNILNVVILGLCLDALSGGLVGLHPFALLLTTWIASIRARQFRLFNMAHQLFGVLGLCLVYQTVILLVQWMLNYPVSLQALIMPAIMSTLCWPWLQYLGDSAFFTKIR